MRKILLVFGTRPEAIKMAPVHHELKADGGFDVKLCVTGQHRELIAPVMKFFDLRPDFDLKVMTENQTLAGLTARILEQIDGVYEAFEPDVVLVHGDTTTSTTAALAAFYRRIKVGHVEAGLRTYNKLSPFPEELNRQITARLTDYHFAPTEIARENLLREGVADSSILVTGNTVIDALFLGLKNLDHYRSDELDFVKDFWTKNALFEKKVILVTGHRREKFGEGMHRMCAALIRIADSDPMAHIVYPVHLNPNVKDVVHERLSGHKQIHLIPPLGYEAFLWAMNEVSIIVTDSGGVQEEAPSLAKPVLVTRDTTERPEAVSAGFATIVATDVDLTVRTALEKLKPEAAAALKGRANPYGDGKAASRIAKFLGSKGICE